jgi:biopolymer transport protein TolR
MQLGESGKQLSEINVVPLVDIMLVLLIIFMVSAPMMQEGVPLTLPQADAAPVEIDENEIIISVTREREYYINDVQTDFGSLGAQLQSLRAESPNRKVFLRADDNVPYGAVVRALAAAERAGIHDLGMLTEPEGR